MNNKPYKLPDLETFRKVVRDKAGNLAKVAETFRVARMTIWEWRQRYPEYDAVVRDERMQLFDECLSTARVVALGIPAYRLEEYPDENGITRTRRVMDGWIERPDANMLRYFISSLGKQEGFGENPVNEDGTVKEGVPIKAWIQMMNDGDKTETSL